MSRDPEPVGTRHGRRRAAERGEAELLRVPKGVHIEAYQESVEVGKGNDQVFTFYRTEPPEDVEKLQRLTLPKMPE